MGTITRIGPNNPSVDEVRTTLIQALDDLDSGELVAQKALLVFLDETPVPIEDATMEDETTYNISMRNAGMKLSENIALLDAAKFTLHLSQAGFVYEGD